MGKANKPHFRFHVVSLPHTQTTSEFNACAYTMKVVKFCRMMKSLGHEVFLYASEDNEAPCDELITIVSKEEQANWFGEYDFTQSMFKIDWDQALPYWQIPNARAVKAIQERAEPRDFICLIGGVCQKQIADGLPDMTPMCIVEDKAGNIWVGTRNMGLCRYNPSGAHTKGAKLFTSFSE